MSEENRLDNLLRKPFIDQLDDNTLKIRRNLLLIASLAIFLNHFGLSISEGSVSVLGTKIDHLSNQAIRVGLLVSLGYHLVHFTWIVWEHLFEWRVRLTGTKLERITAGTFASEAGDYPSDPRQSTLYHWWSGQAQKIGNLREIIPEVRVDLKALQGFVSANGDPNNPTNVGNITRSLVSVEGALNRFEAHLKEVSGTLSSLRIPESLKRFDRWFFFVVKAQNLRFVILEISLPFLIGLAGMIALTR
jgi:hypothetical protein